MIPLTTLAGHGMNTFHLNLNGSTNADFVVDTGSDDLIATQSLVNALGLAPQPGIGRDGRPVLWLGHQANIVTVNHITFPEATVQGQWINISSQMMVLPDFPEWVKAQGIFGCSLLRNC